MKKEKVLLFVVRASIVVGGIALFYGLFNDVAWITITGGILLVFQAILETYLTDLRERDNPLSYKRKCEALAFISSNRFGIHDDFVAQFGDKMYEHFLYCGYIHEVSEEQEGTEVLCWYTTKCGLRKGLEVN